MNLHQLFLTENAGYKVGVTMTPKGIMVHSTGANNPWLRRYVGPDDGELVNSGGNHWNTLKPSGISVCVHAFIGKLADGTVATYQTLPWTFRGWHAGGCSRRNGGQCWLYIITKNPSRLIPGSFFVSISVNKTSNKHCLRQW